MAMLTRANPCRSATRNEVFETRAGTNEQAGESEELEGEEWKGGGRVQSSTGGEFEPSHSELHGQLFAVLSVRTKTEVHGL